MGAPSTDALKAAAAASVVRKPTGGRGAGGDGRGAAPSAAAFVVRKPTGGRGAGDDGRGAALSN